MTVQLTLDRCGVVSWKRNRGNSIHGVDSLKSRSQSVGTQKKKKKDSVMFQLIYVPWDLITQSSFYNIYYNLTLVRNTNLH